MTLSPVHSSSGRERQLASKIKNFLYKQIKIKPGSRTCLKITEFKYNGARALVHLHEVHLRSFYTVWKQAKKKGIKLPETRDEDYKSMETLLRHVLNSAGGYMNWICDKLGLQDPGINQVPSAEIIEKEAESYIDHLLVNWSLPLAEIEETKFFDKVYMSNWGTEYCIEAMLEHAVMHPIRHEFQLKNLMRNLSA